MKWTMHTNRFFFLFLRLYALFFQLYRIYIDLYIWNKNKNLNAHIERKNWFSTASIIPLANIYLYVSMYSLAKLNLIYCFCVFNISLSSHQPILKISDFSLSDLFVLSLVTAHLQNAYGFCLFVKWPISPCLNVKCFEILVSKIQEINAQVSHVTIRLNIHFIYLTWPLTFPFWIFGL